MKKLITIVAGFILTLPSMLAEEARLPYETVNDLKHLSFGLSSQNKFNAVVNKQPEGTEYEMYRNGNAYLVYGQMLMGTRVSGYQASIVEQSDGTVWIKKPFSQIETGWLKAEKGLNDTLVVNLPQEIYREGLSIYYANRMVYKASYDDLNEIVGDYVSDDKSSIKFIYRDGVLEEVADAINIVRDEANNLVEQIAKPMLALTDKNGNWTGFGDYNIMLRRFSDAPVKLPSYLVANDYLMKYYDANETELSLQSKVAFDGNDVYINIYPNLPDSWVKGNIKNGKVVFKSGQYLGTYESQGLSVYLYFVTGTHKLEYNESAEQNEYVFEISDEAVFELDNDSKSFTSDAAIFVNCGKDRVHKIYSYVKPGFTTVSDVAATPIAPVIIEFYNYDPDEEYGYIEFDAPNKDIDGNFLDMDKFYFRLYKDNEIVEFTPDEYMSIEEPTSLIPFTLSDYMDFLFYDDSKHGISFYFDDYQSIGVQSVYVGGGETRCSDIVRVGDVSALTEIELSKTPKQIKYYDVTGRVVTSPKSGLFIKVIMFEDGCVKNEKVLNR